MAGLTAPTTGRGAAMSAEDSRAKALDEALLAVLDWYEKNIEEGIEGRADVAATGVTLANELLTAARKIATASKAGAE